MNYKEETLKIKSGAETKEVNYGMPDRATLANLLQAGGDAASIIWHAFGLGYKSIIRNHVNAGRGAPANLEEAVKLAAEAEANRGGSGEALAQYRASIEAFLAWAKAAGKSAKAQAILKQLAGSKKALALQPEEIRERMRANVESWAATLDDAALEAHASAVSSLLEACEGVDMDADDF